MNELANRVLVGAAGTFVGGLALKAVQRKYIRRVVRHVFVVFHNVSGFRVWSVDPPTRHPFDSGKIFGNLDPRHVKEKKFLADIGITTTTFAQKSGKLSVEYFRKGL